MKAQILKKVAKNLAKKIAKKGAKKCATGLCGKGTKVVKGCAKCCD